MVSLLLSIADPLEREKDHSAYQVREQIKVKITVKRKGEGSKSVFMASSLGEILALQVSSSAISFL